MAYPEMSILNTGLSLCHPRSLTTPTPTGTGRESGLLPRALVSIFGKLRGRLYDSPDLKPVLCEEVRRLNGVEVRAEEARRDSLLKEVRGEELIPDQPALDTGSPTLMGPVGSFVPLHLTQRNSS